MKSVQYLSCRGFHLRSIFRQPPSAVRLRRETETCLPYCKVYNHAMGGRSTKSFIDEGRWAAIMDKLGKGDLVVAGMVADALKALGLV